MSQKFKKNKLIFLSLFAFSILSISTNAQTNADLELKVQQPLNNPIIPFGDTITVKLTIINHGPEEMIGDTILIGNNQFPGYLGVIDTIPVGDSVTHIAIRQWADSINGPVADEIFDVCYYFKFSVLNQVHDTNSTNDTACLEYTMLGNIPTGINKVNAGNNLEIYPNPAIGIVHIALDINESTPISVSITDILGKNCYLKDFGMLKIGKNREINLDVSTLKSGIYFLTVNNNGQRFVRKLIIQ